MTYYFSLFIILSALQRYEKNIVFSCTFHKLLIFVNERNDIKQYYIIIKAYLNKTKSMFATLKSYPCYIKDKRGVAN